MIFPSTTFPMVFFQDDPFFAELTVYETLCFASRLVGQSNQNAQQEADWGGTVAPVRCFGCFFLQRKSGMKNRSLTEIRRIRQITCFFCVSLVLQKPFSSSFLVAVFVSECKSFIVSQLVCSFIQKLWKVQLSKVFLISTSKRPGFFLSKASLLVLHKWPLCLKVNPLKNKAELPSKTRGPICVLSIYAFICRYLWGTAIHVTFTIVGASMGTHQICQAQGLLQRVGLAAAAFRYRWLGVPEFQDLPAKIHGRWDMFLDFGHESHQF